VDQRYHVEFKDEYGNKSLGLMLTELPQLGLNRRLINPYAARTGTGSTKYSDLTEWTVVAQEDWRGGRGQDRFEDDDAFYDSYAVETRVEGQVTLGPYPHAPDSSVQQNEGAFEYAEFFGDIRDTINSDFPEERYGSILDTYTYAQLVREPMYDYGVYAPRITSVDLYLKKAATLGDGTTITLSLYSAGQGETAKPVHIPEQEPYTTGLEPDSLLGSATLNGSDLGTDWAWETFTFGTPIDVGDYEYYFITLTHDDSGEFIYWAANDDDPYPSGDAMRNLGSGWSTIRAGYDMLFKLYRGEIKLAQQFTTGGSGFNLATVSVFGGDWYSHVAVSLYSDSGADAPDTELKKCVIAAFGSNTIASVDGANPKTVIHLDGTAPTDRMEANMWVEINGDLRMIDSVDSDTQITLKSALSADPEVGDRVRDGYQQLPTYDGWKKAHFDSVQALSSATKYWIVVEATDITSSMGDGWMYLGYGGTYANGIAARKIDSGSWSEISGIDFLFRLNDFGLNDTISGFARFNDEIYVAAGDSVYSWSDASKAWSSVDQESGDDCTDICVWGGYIWAARGSDHVIRKSSDGSSWSDVSGENATLLCPGGGQLHFSGTGSDSHKVYGTGDGTTFSEVGECGSGDHPITGLAWYRDILFAATEVQLWSCEVPDHPFPVLNWASQEDEDNGKGMVTWNRTNCLYIPLRYGLYRWNGDSMVAVGPEQGTGLPEERAGNIVDLCPTTNWLYAAIDAGENNMSSVLCYNGMGGWHEIVRHPEESGQRIQALLFSTIETPSRLWYGLGDETRYVELPDRSDNPFNWQSYTFQPTGHVISSWMDGGLIEVVKDIHEIVVRAEGMGENTLDDEERNRIKVFLQVDRNEWPNGDPLWVPWGVAEQSPRKSLLWGERSYHSGSWSKKLIGADSTSTTIEIDGDWTPLAFRIGDFVEINSEVSQIQSVDTSGASVTLASALSYAPLEGDYMYHTQPAGREFRVMVKLESGDIGSAVQDTPKLKAILIRYQNNVLDRFLWTLNIRVEDGMKDLGGAPYPLTAAALRSELDTWATRVTPLTLVDPDGNRHLVKVTSAGEGGYARGDKKNMDNYYGSTYSMNLVEVE